MLLLGVYVAPSLVHAQDPQGFQAGLDKVKTLAGDSGLNTKQQTAPEILQSIVSWLLTLLGTVALMSLLYGGFLYITSQGDEDVARKAKTIILYSIIGIIIIGLSGVIVNVVISIATK